MLAWQQPPQVPGPHTPLTSAVTSAEGASPGHPASTSTARHVNRDILYTII
jgi:hypothetical protein